ncbi:pyridoxamine 5'-phosphate oxidase family protein [Anaerosalibacter massiliensis]|uniref:Pyridoxamine 5'-phosphate oxidase family protein n=1 Tax=Anaerosalibacter massiliensis TaxID=1347392 RepID=A0A9X2MI67_9FIRM|nr:pyridoxamine 5'-phosphate oxidase family protein [Anaerosalibacter massiliensis]MCR2044154.1 pyridoxamine 5'-phosphate oxidase family protein [Anaerosalibacter massiliensis]
MNKKMSYQELKKHILEFLKEHKEGSLGTCMDNIPRSSPVQYFIGNDMDIYIASAGGDKFKAIAKNPNVCLLVNTSYINYRQIKGVQIFGNAITSLEDENLFSEAKKIHPEPYQIEHEKDHIKIIKIKPTEIVYLDSLGDGNRIKQVLKNNSVVEKQG